MLGPKYDKHWCCHLGMFITVLRSTSAILCFSRNSFITLLFKIIYFLHLCLKIWKVFYIWIESQIQTGVLSAFNHLPKTSNN